MDRNSTSFDTASLIAVASFAEAWIETDYIARLEGGARCRLLRGGVDRNGSFSRSTPKTLPSPPSRRRGSKRVDRIVSMVNARVASFAEAWIETQSPPS